MPAKDTYHDALCRALVKDGYEMLDEPIGQLLVAKHLIQAMIFDPLKEEILRWIP